MSHRAALYRTLAIAIAAGMSAGSLGAQFHLPLPTGTVSALIATADHRVDAGFGREQTSGLLFGGQLDIEPDERIFVSLRALGGTLEVDPSTPRADARSVGELSLATRMDLLPWLRGTASVMGRSYEGALARQHWSELAVGGEAHLPLIDGLVDGTLGLSLVPLVKVTGREAPDLAVSGVARLRHAGERMDIAIGYTIESYNFPTVRGVDRVEEFSTLFIRAGVRIGARRPRPAGAATR